MALDIINVLNEIILLKLFLNCLYVVHKLTCCLSGFLVDVLPRLRDCR